MSRGPYMAEIPVLTCPVCDRSAGFDEDALGDPDRLQDAAWDHLAVHRLDESKRAIYAVMMVERQERLRLEADGSFAGPTDEWVERQPAESTP